MCFTLELALDSRLIRRALLIGWEGHNNDIANWQVCRELTGPVEELRD